MFKFLLYLNSLLISITLNDGKSLQRGHLYNKAIEDEKESAQNLWFPHPPNYQYNVKSQAMTSPDSREESVSDNSTTSDWPGLWFPNPPNYESIKPTEEDAVKFKDSDKIYECDNGKYGLSVDFDHQDKRHSFQYLCLGNRSHYTPNLNTSALLREYYIPVAYEPPVKCLNESIQYKDSIPSFGAYRPLAPKYGAYRFLPPQRWLHSLADGAIVLLYHPCAFLGQIEKLQQNLKGCLYRHIITPSQFLTPQYPLVLLAWGKSLQMSVVDDAVVTKFIRDNAKMGFKQMQQKLKISSKLYDAGLLAEAHLVTDEQDTKICGYLEMR